MKKKRSALSKSEVPENLNTLPGKFRLMEKGKDSELHVSLADVDLDALLKSFGTADYQVQTYLLTQVIRCFEGGLTPDDVDKKKYVDACNIALSILHGIKPHDEIETMLVMQMIAVHNLTMQCLGRSLMEGLSPEGRDRMINQGNKLLRTYATQMEALKRYRTGGQQKVTVEHVHVNEGGQAIVGNLSQAGGE